MIMWASRPKFGTVILGGSTVDVSIDGKAIMDASVSLNWTSAWSLAERVNFG